MAAPASAGSAVPQTLVCAAVARPGPSALRPLGRHCRKIPSQNLRFICRRPNFTDTCSGAVACADRPQLQQLAEQLRESDVLRSGTWTAWGTISKTY